MYGPDHRFIFVNNKKRELEEERAGKYNKAKKQWRAEVEQQIIAELKGELERKIQQQIKKDEIDDIRKLKAIKAELQFDINKLKENYTFSVEPRDEAETDCLFRKYACLFDFYSLKRNRYSPDYNAMKIGFDKEITIELEYKSGNFISQGHPNTIDCLVCWRHSTDQLERLPANIIELCSKLVHFYKP